MKKLLLTLLLLFSLGMAAQAQVATFDATKQGYSNAATVTNVKVDDITITFSKGSNTTNAPKYYTSGTAIRMYAGNTVKVEGATDVTISNIVFTTTSALISGFEANVGTVSTSSNSWSGSTNSVTFTNNTGGQVRISKMVITYSTAQDDRSKVVLAFDPTKKEMKMGDEFIAPTLSATVDGVENVDAKAAVVYTSNNEDLLKVSADGTFTLTPNVAGKATVTASIPEGNETFKPTDPVEFELIVLDPNATFADIDFGSYGWENEQQISTVKEGIVTLTFDIAGGNNNPAYFTSAKDVRLYANGTLTISVPEGYYLTKVESVFNKKDNGLTPSYGSFTTDYTEWNNGTKINNTVVFTEGGTKGSRSWTSIKVYYSKIKQDFTPNFSAITLEALAKQDIVVAENAPAINFTSSDDKIATIEGKTITAVGAGEATITATWSEDDNWKAGEATFKVTVNAIPATVAFEQETLLLAVDNEAANVAAVTPESAEIEYSSSNTEVATVSANGVVTAVAAGEATITASIKDTKVYTETSASYKVTVVAAEDVNKLEGNIQWDIVRSPYGMLTLKYVVRLKNYNGEAVSVSMTVCDAKGVELNGLEYYDPTTRKPVSYAEEENFAGLKADYSATGMWSAKGEALGTGTTPNYDNLKVMANAYVGDKQLLDKDVELESAGNTATGIEDVVIDGNDDAEYYTLQGLRVSEPQAGQLYIKRQGGKATKVLVK